MDTAEFLGQPQPLIRFWNLWNYSPDYSLNCTPLTLITITYIYEKQEAISLTSKVDDKSFI